MSFYLQDLDIERHNEDVKAVWEAYHARKPTRVPVVLGVNPRVLLLNPDLNPDGISFQDYSADPDLMARVQMMTQHYVRHNLLQDSEMGPPSDGWAVYPDFQNTYEARWFGAPVEYRPGQVPDTTPILHDDNKRLLFDRGFPDPFAGPCMDVNWRYHEHMKANLGSYSCEGVPAGSAVIAAGLGTDGPMTIACSLRGATELCIDFYEDPDFVRELLRYITEATVVRIKAFRKALGHEEKATSWGFADDSIELLSEEAYRDFVLPCHKALLADLAGDGPHAVHLCGNVDRLIPVLKEELNIDTWDTGFPVDHGRTRRVLGPDFQISGGPSVALLLHGSPAAVEAECRRILESGVTDGGRFVLREGNNLSPCTPVENVTAMYEAAKRHGAYDG